jgi:hypothetical protein
MILCSGMPKMEKREQRIRENPSNVSLEDFEALVSRYGRIRSGGKHPQAVIELRFMAYRRTNPVRVAYVLQLLEYIDNQGAGASHEK